MFKGIPKFLDNEIEISIAEFQLTAKERGVIFGVNCKNEKYYGNSILEYESTYSDAVVGAVAHMKSKSEFSSVKDKLEKLAVKDNEYICKWLEENEENYPLFHSYILHIEKIRVMALECIEEYLNRSNKDE